MGGGEVGEVAADAWGQVLKVVLVGKQRAAIRLLLPGLPGTVLLGFGAKQFRQHDNFDHHTVNFDLTSPNLSRTNFFYRIHVFKTACPVP